ncbi:MAG: hypothetical protein ABSF26_15750 [Thermoguttaceae bacterium]|jgi:alanyl-tRNA synthetase
MIGKVLAMLAQVLAALCVATVIAALILTTYYARAWQLNREKLLEMLAVARGAERPAAAGPHGGPAETAPEQLAYGQVLEARALKARDIDLREQALRGGVQQLQAEQRKLAEEKNRIQQARQGFQQELSTLQKGAAAAGLEDARRTLETIDPKQAKDLLAQMLEKSEIDEVVMLLEGMTESRRAKIIAEFSTPDEMQQVGEVLRRIRRGLPLASMAGTTQEQLDSHAPKPSEPPKGPKP